MCLKHWLNNTACLLLVAFPLRLSAASPLDNWHVRNADASNTLTALTYGDGRFIAVDEVSIYQATPESPPSALLISTNGKDWSRLPTGTNYFGTRGIASQNSTIVVAAYARLGPQLLRSQDAENWSGGLPTPLPRSVKAINGRFVSAGWEFYQFCTESSGFACGSSARLWYWYPSNVVAWWSAELSSLSSEESFLGADMAYGNGTWVVIGWIGGDPFFNPFHPQTLVAWRSAGGTNYQRTVVAHLGLIPSLPSPYLNRPMSLAFGNGTFVAAVGLAKLFASSDGITWTNREPSSTQSWSAVTFGAGQFVAVGSPGVLLTSQDGLAWTPRSSGTNASLSSISYGNHSFVAAGEQVVLQSDPIHTLAIVNGSSPRLTLDGPTGSDYRIEATENPTSTDSWQTVTNFLSVITPFDWADAEAPSSSRRFYRAVLIEP